MNDEQINQLFSIGNTSNKLAFGFTTEDPANSLPIGQKLCFNPVRVTHNFESNAVWLKNWESFDGILLLIHFSNSKSHGSAVLVAPGIAISARHVIEPRTKDLLSGQAFAIAIAITEHGLLAWRINKITYVNNSDLVIIGLSYASDLPPHNMFSQASITTRLPKVGENLLITGFKVDLFEIDYDDKTMFLNGNVLACNGSISNIYLVGRDRAMLSWPTLEINCPSFGGMSGGPVFDSKGMLVGILSSSFSGDGPSYVSLLWPALTTDFEGGWPIGLFSGKRKLIDIDPRLCTIDKRDGIVIEKSKTRIKIWE